MEWKTIELTTWKLGDDDAIIELFFVPDVEVLLLPESRAAAAAVVLFLVLLDLEAPN